MLSPVSVGAIADPPPQEALETFLGAIRSMEFPITDEIEHDRLVNEANAFLDLQTMVTTALHEHWTQATSGERDAFLALMWELIEHVAYAGSRDFLGNFRISYPEILETKGGFDVHSVIEQDEEALNATVVYHLAQHDAQWKIQDIILDDVSIIEDLRYQFDKIILDTSFSGLLDRMRERLAQAKAQTQGQAA